MTKIVSIDGVEIVQKNYQQVLIRGDGKEQFNQIINKEILIQPPSRNLEISLSNKYVFGINTNGYFVIMLKQNGKIIFSKFLKDKKKRKVIPIKILLNKTNILISTNSNKSLLLELNNLGNLDYKKIKFDQYMHTLNHTFLLNRNRVLRIN